MVPTYFSELKETINVIVYVKITIIKQNIYFLMFFLKKNHNEDNYNKGLRIIVLGLTLGFGNINKKLSLFFKNYRCNNN